MEYIRKATQEDTERIRYIVEECWGLASSDAETQNDINSMVHDFYSQSKLTNEINNNISAFLLAIDGEFVVAFASYKFNSNNVKSSEINALYCLPETQGKRFDELLINEVIKNTIAAGGNKIFVVLNRYDGMISLFERLGFKSVKANDPKKINSEILVMSKNLGPASNETI